MRRIANSGDKKENSFTPKVNLAYQLDPNDLFYATYAKGFRPGGANNPVPQAACAADFQSFGITASPATYDSDTVNSYEIGAKNNIANRCPHRQQHVLHALATTSSRPSSRRSARSRSSPISGPAVAKGADIQAEIAVTERAHRPSSPPATRMRATRRTPSYRSTQATPIVSSGDAISGQERPAESAAPFTASLGPRVPLRGFWPRVLRPNRLRIPGARQVAAAGAGSEHAAVRRRQLHAAVDELRVAARGHDLQ